MTIDKTEADTGVVVLHIHNSKDKDILKKFLLLLEGSDEETELKPALRYPLSDAAKLIGVSVKTIERWADAGKISIHYYKNRRGRYLTGKQINECRK